jgi:molybdenum cofactor cytidylyltransferase
VSTALPGVVLAAGASQRMGRPKALLPTGASGLPFVRVICDTLVAAGVSPLVVTRAELVESIKAVLPGTTLVVNPEPDRGQLSSLLLGLDALGPRDAVLVTLVDLPRFRPTTVAALISTWHRTHAPLVRPVHEGRHGHPAIFGEPLLRALRSADVSLGAKPVIQRFSAEAIEVAVDDPGTVDDIDTPEAYKRLERP